MDLQPLPIDEPLLSLNPDQKAVVLKTLTELMQGVHFAHKQLEAGALSESLAKTILSLTESHLVKVCKQTGIAIESVAEREERYAQLRAANERIRELKAKLGDAVTAASVKEAIARLGRKVTRWWRVSGLGHVSELEFSQNGHCIVTLSCGLYGDFSMTMSETPVSDKERRLMWHRHLEAQGFVLKKSQYRDDDQILDCDASKKALKALIKNTFPSAEVTQSDTRWERGGEPTLRQAKVYIYNLQDIDALPDSSED